MDEKLDCNWSTIGLHRHLVYKLRTTSMSPFKIATALTLSVGGFLVLHYTRQSNVANVQVAVAVQEDFGGPELAMKHVGIFDVLKSE